MPVSSPKAWCRTRSARKIDALSDSVPSALELDHSPGAKLKLATVTMLVALATASAHAQVLRIVGTWTLDRGRTVYPGPLPDLDTGKDERTVEWIDKVRGPVTLRGTRSVSEDGDVLTIVATTVDPASPQTFTLVYTREEPAETPLR
jgi:hypothetical protein